MDKQEAEKMFYHPICSLEEIERIFDVRTAEDYLLKLRADTAVDHMRIFRVLRNRYLHSPDGWSLTDAFSQRPFKKFVSLLPKEEKSKCRSIISGFVFCNDPNGACMRTDFGDIMTLSSSLEYFFFYMNMAFLNFDFDVPDSVRIAAMRIAIRVMLKTEALDFDMDPRGIIPKQLEIAVNRLVRLQLLFVAGHEYGHHIHDHLDKNNTVRMPLFLAIRSDRDGAHEQSERFYSTREKQELEADTTSIMLPNMKEEDRGEVAFAAILWFAYLDVFEKVADQLFPVSPWSIRTHPYPMERLENIYDISRSMPGISRDRIDELIESTGGAREFLQEDVAVNTNVYETYGSVYLAEPNTQWRGRQLVDRVDYY